MQRESMRPRRPRPRLLHRLAVAGERIVDALRVRRRLRRPLIEPYAGYATPDAFILRGRVLTKRIRHAAQRDTSRGSNAREILRLFATDEVAGVRVACGAHETQSDEEGYFRLSVPRPPSAQAPWHVVSLRLPDVERRSCEVRVRVPAADARRLVISDIDDTVMETGAHQLARSLWTTFTGSALTRHIYPHAKALLAALSEGDRNPVFYVSSSPWNLHPFLTQVFARARLPAGPMFLTDYGVSETKLIKPSHGAHKSAAIDALMAAVPHLPVVLVGDTGQHDATIYADACERYADRIERVILHQPAGGLSDEARRGIARLQARPLELFVERDYAQALAAIQPEFTPEASDGSW